MRSASSGAIPSSAIACATAPHRSRSAPASTPSSVSSRALRRSTRRPCSMNSGRSVPAGGIASLTSSMPPAGLAASARRSIAGCTWMPSTMMPQQAAGSVIAARAIPGARPASGGIALNRWVKPLIPARRAAWLSSRLAAEWPPETCMPAAARRAIVAGGTCSGASVSSTRPPPDRSGSPQSQAMSASSGGRMKCRRCTPARSGLRNGPSRCTPSTPLPGIRAASDAAAAAARITAGVSVITVGSTPVVPSLRCAAAMPSAPRRVGVSLKPIPPPPLTCRSIRPGASSQDAGRSVRSADVAADAGSRSRMRPSSISSACPSRIVSPVKMRAPARSCLGRGDRYEVVILRPRCRPILLPPAHRRQAAVRARGDRPAGSPGA